MRYRPGHSWWASLEAKLVAFTSVVLALISATLFLELEAREKTKLIEAKAHAATMLVQLLASELAAAIDFGDLEGAAARLADLRANPDTIGAAVWPEGAREPSTTWSVPGAPALANPGPADSDGVDVHEDWLLVTRRIVGPQGKELARTRVALSLAPENEALRRGRVQLLWMTVGLAGLTAVLLVLFARRYVVAPLRRLSDAATALAGGDLSAQVEVRSSDEIGSLAVAFNTMGKAVAFREEQLKKELDLAQQIQTSILPGTVEVPDLAIAARMVPASRVGGDYYDVLPVTRGCWIGIGDVAGHGLDAGLVMLMIQSVIAGLVVRESGAAPSEIVCTLNEVLFDNIHNRLRRDDHATLTLLRYDRSGRVAFAGAHEELVVYRAKEGRCEIIPTRGTWVGGRRDISKGTVDTSLRLAPGDVMLLHTDGATEIRNAKGVELGIERLCAELERVCDQPVREIVEHLHALVRGWGTPEDDVTFLVGRYGA